MKLEFKEHDKARARLKWLDIKSIKTRFKLRFQKHRVLLINMELKNGFHTSFVVAEKEDGFKYRGNKYIFDEENKYYSLSSNLNCYDYHEGFALPIKRKMPVQEIKKALEISDITDIQYMANPQVLERFTVSKIAEGLLKGQQIDEFFKQIRMFMIVTMISSLATLILFIWSSGMLKEINLPF
jgi:hypothetical protein